VTELEKALRSIISQNGDCRGLICVNCPLESVRNDIDCLGDGGEERRLKEASRQLYMMEGGRIEDFDPMDQLKISERDLNRRKKEAYERFQAAYEASQKKRR